jgi:fumarate reductase iron-sulfur subunit
MQAAAARKLKFEIFRFNPEDPASKPRMASYELAERPFMTLYSALNKIREEQDPTLQFDFSCRSAVCGACGMMVNGRPTLACKSLTSQLNKRIRLHPLPAFRLVGDLSVDTGSWFRGMSERVQGWIQEKAPFDPAAQEERMDDDLARLIYERERCIECGCCVASCAVANTRPAFVAPAGLNRIARFMMDPRDRRKDADWFEVIASDEGVFGCLGLMACQDVCPKDLPLREVYAYLRRKSLAGVLARGRSKPR